MTQKKIANWISRLSNEKNMSLQKSLRYIFYFRSTYWRSRCSWWNIRRSLVNYRYNFLAQNVSSFWSWKFLTWVIIALFVKLDFVLTSRVNCLEMFLTWSISDNSECNFFARLIALTYRNNAYWENAVSDKLISLYVFQTMISEIDLCQIFRDTHLWIQRTVMRLEDDWSEEVLTFGDFHRSL